MEEACDVGMQNCSLSPSLPHEVIEMNILSRLPVKDLLRFRVVCKQWEATISNPTFAEIHLHIQRYSRSLLAWPNLFDDKDLHVAELRNNCIEFVSAIQFGLDEQDSDDLCSCNGLYLKYLCPPTLEEGHPVKCVLWNPSCRTYREFYSPPSIRAYKTSRSIHAIYYDPLTKDYKIVIADMKHYAVYSCRDRKWGDVKEMKGFLWDHCEDMGVFVNGSIYWLVLDWLGPTVFKCDHRFREIICFDCKDESFKILPLPKFKNRDKNAFELTAFGGQLYLFISSWKSNRLKIMKKVTSGDGNDEWMESKELKRLLKCRSKSFPLTPVCQMSENELLFHGWRRSRMVYMMYDKSKNTVVKIHNNHPEDCFDMLPAAHLENLFLL